MGIIEGEELRLLQINELMLLAEVDRICRENSIGYSLDGGTLLGAIRHKGFIPWDDDADVVFLRNEYERFKAACETKLNKEAFMLQDYKTDPYYRWGYAKMRLLGTEYVKSGQERLKFHTGVCIDIFVLDNVPDNPVRKRLNFGWNTMLRKILYSELGMYQENSFLLRLIYRILYLIPKKAVFFARNFFARKNNKKETELVSHLLFPYPSKASKYGIPKRLFNEYVDVEYEGIFFKIVKDYDRYLKLLYGDYMKLPPTDKRHGGAKLSKLELRRITLEEILQEYNSFENE